MKKKPEKDKKFQSKAIVSSCSSTNTESTASVSSSDSESSVESTKSPPVVVAPTPAPKKAAVVVAKLGRAKTSKPEPVKTDKVYIFPNANRFFYSYYIYIYLIPLLFSEYSQ